MEQYSGEKLVIEDAVLVQQVQEGEIRAFEQLVLKYQERVYNVCLRIVNHTESARDLAQETFLKALRAIRDFQFQSSFFTWLFRIAVNLSISHRRRDRHLRMQSLDGDRDDTKLGEQALKLRSLLPDNTAVSPAERMGREELHRAVTGALAELEEDQRAVVVLRDMESLDYETIASILQVPVGTVRSRLHRARLALRELLKPAMEKVG